MKKDELAKILKEKDLNDIKLTINDFSAILANYSTNIDEIFAYDMPCFLDDYQREYSVIAAIIHLIKEEELIENEKFIKLLLDNPHLLTSIIFQETNEINAVGAKFTVIGSIILSKKPKILILLLEKYPEILNQRVVEFSDGREYTTIGLAISQSEFEMFDLLITRYPKLLTQKAQSYSDGQEYTPIGVAISWGKIEMVNLLLQKDPELLTQKAFRCLNGREYTPIGVAIRLNKIDILNFLLQKDPELLTQIAGTSLDRQEYTPIGVAMECNRTEMINFLLQKDPELLTQKTLRLSDGREFTPIGVAILSGKPKIVNLLLQKDRQLLTQIAGTYPNEQEYTPIGVAIKWGITKMINLLLEQDPQLVNQSAAIFKNGIEKSPLRLVLYFEFSDRPSIITEIINILLDYGANEEGIFTSLNEEQQTKFNNNKKTKLFFEDDKSTIKENEINKKYLLNLCKQFGAPRHLSKIGNFLSYHLTESFQKDNDISVHIADILYNSDPTTFKVTPPYKILKNLQDPNSTQFSNPINRSDDILSTIRAYEENEGRLKPENIYKFRRNVDFYLELFIRFPETGRSIIEASKNWILPREEHLHRADLSKKFLEAYQTPLVIVASSLQESLLDLQETVSHQAEIIADSQMIISKLLSETPEEKQERQTQQDMQLAARARGQRTIEDYYKKISTKDVLKKTDEQPAIPNPPSPKTTSRKTDQTIMSNDLGKRKRSG